MTDDADRPGPSTFGGLVALLRDGHELNIWVQYRDEEGKPRISVTDAAVLQTRGPHGKLLTFVRVMGGGVLAPEELRDIPGPTAFRWGVNVFGRANSWDATFVADLP